MKQIIIKIFKMIKSKYFPESDFKKLKTPCSLQNMDQRFMDMMDLFREKIGCAVIPTSAYRGRGGSSAHDQLPCKAMDVVCQDGVTRDRMIRAAIEVGFKRIGIGQEFIHLDTSDIHAQNVIWHYY